MSSRDARNEGDVVLRVHKQDGYKIISTWPLDRDDRLSWKAKGVLNYLVTRPTPWKFYKKDLLQRATDARTSLDNGLEELKAAGYLKMEPDRAEDGTIDGWRWTVSELPRYEWANEHLRTRTDKEDSPKVRFPTDGFPRIREIPTDGEHPHSSKQDSSEETTSSEKETTLGPENDDGADRGEGGGEGHQAKPEGTIICPACSDEVELVDYGQHLQSCGMKRARP